MTGRAELSLPAGGGDLTVSRSRRNERLRPWLDAPSRRPIL